MANEINEIEAGASRINHPVYRDVYNTTFDKDVIVDFEMADDGKLSGICQTAKYGWLPVFYHCKRHCYTESIADLESNDSLNGGVMAFEVKHDVKVLLEKEKPRFVIDHFEQHNPPYMCADIFRLTFPTWSGEGHEQFYICSDAGILVGGVDHYGDTPNCDQDEIILFGQREFQTGTVQNYWSDRFVKIGPVFYIVRIDSIGLPGILTKSFVVFKNVWTQEREDLCIEIGAIAEKTIGGAFSPLPTWPVYPDVVIDNGLSLLLTERFSGLLKEPAPHWVFSKFYGQSYEI